MAHSHSADHPQLPPCSRPRQKGVGQVTEPSAVVAPLHRRKKRSHTPARIALLSLRCRPAPSCMLVHLHMLNVCARSHARYRSPSGQTGMLVQVGSLQTHTTKRERACRARRQFIPEALAGWGTGQHAHTPAHLHTCPWSHQHRSGTRKPGGQEPELALRALLVPREYAPCDPCCRVMPRSRNSLRSNMRWTRTGRSDT